MRKNRLHLHLRSSFSRLATACAFSLVLAGCGSSSTSPQEMVQTELISIKPITGEKVKLMLKVTNVSREHIVRAKASVTVLDDQGNTLGTKSTYLIHSTKGGLEPGASVEEDAFIDVSDKTKATDVRVEMERVSAKE